MDGLNGHAKRGRRKGVVGSPYFTLAERAAGVGLDPWRVLRWEDPRTLLLTERLVDGLEQRQRDRLTEFAELTAALMVTASRGELLSLLTGAADG